MRAITRVSTTLSMHVVTHARIPVCGDRGAGLCPDQNDRPDTLPFGGPYASVRDARLPRLTKTQRHAFGPAVQSITHSLRLHRHAVQLNEAYPHGRALGHVSAARPCGSSLIR